MSRLKSEIAQAESEGAVFDEAGIQVAKTVKGSGWKAEYAMVRRFYPMTHEEFVNMDEMRLANLVSEIKPIMEWEGQYMAVAMWGRGKKEPAKNRKR